jgi:2-polyprenyl-3-methyl-5-hydroxy-6-metoxy-1,4-benzoquinol methylase
MAILVIGPLFSGTARFLKGDPCTVRLRIHELSFDCQVEPSSLTDDGSGCGELNFSKLISSVQINRCTVLVSSIGALQRNIMSGSRTLTKNADAELAKRLSQIDFFRFYEDLFDSLGSQGIRYSVIYLPDIEQCHFLPTDRAYVHHNLHGRYCCLPSANDVEIIAADPRCWYQQVGLPYGMQTRRREFSHLGAGRRTTFSLVLRSCITGASVLDIGSAMGGLLFAAERLGAAKLVGVEVNESRVQVARQIADVLKSKAEFYRNDFSEFCSEQIFDHVYALNVLHHVRDFDSFLRKAARSARKRLILEFPTLTDAKFITSHGLRRDELAAAESLPLIGVSSERADQTYVYSRRAIKSIMDEIGGFNGYREINSPIQDRVITIFSRAT